MGRASGAAGLRRALAAERDGDLDEAVAAYERVLGNEPVPVVLYRYGCLLARHGDHDRAVAVIERAIDGAGEDAPGTWYARLGAARDAAGETTAAAQSYQAAIDRDPSVLARYEELGRLRRAARDWLGAAEAFKGACLRAPHRADLWHWWGDSVAKTQDLVTASYLLQRADRIAREQAPGRLVPSTRLPFERRAQLSLVRRPQYAYGLHRSCRLAAKLGVERITAIEFGVAGGNGLVAMEDHAAELEELTGVGIDVVGFDTGEGLFEPVDHRDMPYFFAAGSYAIDLPALRARLRRAHLIIGDAADTFGEFLAGGVAPIALVAFDMDVYSATAGVMRHLGDGAVESRFLPRVSVYFDDVTGHQGQDYNRFAGELLAIDEFNEHHHHTKLAEDRALRTWPIDLTWHHGMYTLHRFAHPEYGTYVSPAGPSSLGLRDT